MDPEEDTRGQSKMTRKGIGAWIVYGCLAGTVAGIIFSDISMGMLIGVCLGILIGAIVRGSRKI